MASYKLFIINDILRKHVLTQFVLYIDRRQWICQIAVMLGTFGQPFIFQSFIHVYIAFFPRAARPKNIIYK